MTAQLYSLKDFTRRAYGETIPAASDNRENANSTANKTEPFDNLAQGFIPERARKDTLQQSIERIDSRRLYGNVDGLDQKNQNATAALISCCTEIITLLKQAETEITNGDEIEADLTFMGAKKEAKGLLHSIHLSDGVGLVVSSVARTFSAILYAKDSLDIIAELVRALEELKSKPNLAFSSAMSLCEALEQVSDTPELAIFTEIRAALLDVNSE